MAIKSNHAFSPKQNLPKVPLVKYVKKASMYCTTTFDEKGKQTQVWSIEKP